MQAYPASIAQFSREGKPFAAGDVLRQPDLAAADELPRVVGGLPSEAKGVCVA